jgi:PAS domain S-box-containing protein
MPEEWRASLDEVLTVDQLDERPRRPADAAAEAAALTALAEAFAGPSQALLQKLAEIVAPLCRADSSGVTLLETDGPNDVVRWRALTGPFAHNLNKAMPRDASPCGAALVSDRVLLFDRPARHFGELAPLEPPIAECLLAPFHADGRPVGTVWAMSHTPGERFDAEDARLLLTLSRFASAGYKAQFTCNETYRRLFESFDDGFCIIECFFAKDASGNERCVDYRFLETNLAFENQTGLCQAIGRTARGLMPQLEGHWFETFGRVALTGRAVRFQAAAMVLGGRWYDVYAFRAGSPSERRVGILFRDITQHRKAEEALRTSEERLRLIVETATDFAIFTLDEQRRVTSWSPGAEILFGYSEHDIVGRSGDLLFTPEDRAANIPQHETLTARRDGRAEDERWHLRRDGSRFYASGVTRPLPGDHERGYVKIARDLTDRKRMEDELKRAHDRLEARVAQRTAELVEANAARVDLLRRLVTTQEDERRRIARELHDQMGQSLTALLLGLNSIGGRLPPDSPVHEGLRRLRAIADEIGREIHQVALELRPTVLDDLGLQPALAHYVEAWSSRTGIVVDFHSGQWTERLSPHCETALYRVAQEALTNVARHAHARQVSVVLDRRDRDLLLIIEDDGMGFDVDAAVDAARGHGRLGLLGMRERLAAVGGTLDIESSSGSGTTIFARAPWGGRQGSDHV